MRRAEKLLWLLALLLMVTVSVLAPGCARGPSRPAYEGAAAGAAVGAAAGVLLDDENRWRGGVIGGALGAVLGGALGEISNRAAREAAARNRPVAYTNQAGTRRVEAYPAGRTPRGCRKVVEKHYLNGRLVKVVEREVCP